MATVAPHFGHTCPPISTPLASTSGVPPNMTCGSGAGWPCRSTEQRLSPGAHYGLVFASGSARSRRPVFGPRIEAPVKIHCPTRWKGPKGGWSSCHDVPDQPSGDPGENERARLIGCLSARAARDLVLPVPCLVSSHPHTGTTVDRGAGTKARAALSTT